MASAGRRRISSTSAAASVRWQPLAGRADQLGHGDAADRRAQLLVLGRASSAGTWATRSARGGGDRGQLGVDLGLGRGQRGLGLGRLGGDGGEPRPRCRPARRRAARSAPSARAPGPRAGDWRRLSDSRSSWRAWSLLGRGDACRRRAAGRRGRPCPRRWRPRPRAASARGRARRGWCGASITDASIAVRRWPSSTSCARSRQRRPPVAQLVGVGVVVLEVEQVVEVAHRSSFTQPGGVRRIDRPGRAGVADARPGGRRRGRRRGRRGGGRGGRRRAGIGGVGGGAVDHGAAGAAGAGTTADGTEPPLSVP